MSRQYTSDGGERGDLGAFGQSSGTVQIDTTSKVTGPNSVYVGAGGWLTSLSFPSSNAEVFAQARIRFATADFAGWNPNPGTLIFSFLTSTFGGLAYAQFDATGILRLYSAGGTLLATSSALNPNQANLTFLIAFHCLLATSGGTFEARVDGQVIASATNVNTSSGGPTLCAAVRWYGGPSGGGNLYVDDAVANINDASGSEDGYPADIRIARMGPNASGHITGLTAVGGTNVANVQPNPPSNSTTNYNDTSTSGNYDSYTPTSPTPAIPAGSTISGVSVDAQVLTQNSPQSGKVHLYTHATDYASAAIALPTSYARIANRWRINPNTGLAWTVADAEAAEMGVGLA